MYSLVLMVAMSQGAATPAWEIDHPRPGNTNFIHAEAHQHNRHGCHGCHGCYGGCYGCYGGCYGCYGGCYGCYGGCYGGYGGRYYGGYAPMGYVSSGYYSPGYYGTATPQGTRDGQVRSDTAATLVVSLPEGATLKIDDFVSQSTAATRQFVSPPLEPGSDYHYDLTAELMRDGKPVTVSKRVTVRPGETTRVTIDSSGVRVAQR
jgi:uncharacterized protein (TIGR03000 family)